MVSRVIVDWKRCRLHRQVGDKGVAVFIHTDELPPSVVEQLRAIHRRGDLRVLIGELKLTNLLREERMCEDCRKRVGAA